MGLGPLYPGMLAGDYVHIRVCAQIHRDLARDDIYIHITIKHIYVCAHVVSVSR